MQTNAVPDSVEWAFGLSLPAFNLFDLKDWLALSGGVDL